MMVVIFDSALNCQPGTVGIKVYIYIYICLILVDKGPHHVETWMLVTVVVINSCARLVHQMYINLMVVIV